MYVHVTLDLLLLLKYLCAHLASLFKVFIIQNMVLCGTNKQQPSKYVIFRLCWPIYLIYSIQFNSKYPHAGVIHRYIPTFRQDVHCRSVPIGMPILVSVRPRFCIHAYGRHVGRKRDTYNTYCQDSIWILNTLGLALYLLPPNDHCTD